MIALPLFVLLCCLAVSEADGVGAEKQVQELYRAGSQYFQAKKYNEAKEVWAYLLQIIPQFQVLWTNLGLTYEAMLEYEEAVTVYKEALAKFGDEETELYSRLCELRTRQYLDTTIKGNNNPLRMLSNAEAKTYCNHALKRHPSEVSNYGTTGMLYVESLEYENGIWYLEQGLKLDPVNLNIIHSLGVAYSRLGNMAKVVELSRKSIELSPTSSNYHSEGIARSVVFNEDPVAFESFKIAARLAAESRPGDSCSAYSVVFGWENETALESMGSQVEVSVIESPSAEAFGDELPRYPSYPGVKEDIEALSLPPQMRYMDREVVLVNLKNVFVEGHTGVFYSEEKCLIFSGGHKGQSKIEPEFKKNPVMRKVTIKSPVASLLQQNPGNYYHFTVEVFARFLYLYDHVLMKKGNEKVKIIVSAAIRSYVEELIVGKYNFPASRIIYYEGVNGVLYFLKNVYIADWHWTPEFDLHPNDASSSYFPPRTVIQRIRRELTAGKATCDPKSPGSCALDKKSPKTKIVYISRHDATVRKLGLGDERRLIVSLMNNFGVESVHWVMLQGLSIEKQKNIFRDATVIIAPHGAGMTNMIWARDGAAVIMLPMKPFTDNCFGYLSYALNHKFWIIPSFTSYYYGVFDELTDESIGHVVTAVQSAISSK